MRKILFCWALFCLLLCVTPAFSATGPSAARPEPGRTGDEARLLQLQGSYNTRGFGGYPAAGGKRIRRGLIYRSDTLSQLTPGDLDSLRALNIKTIVDFRTSEEIARAPNRAPQSVGRQINLDIEVGNIIDLTRATSENGPKRMLAVNRVLVGRYQERYREFFSLIADSGNLPLLFNCSAGKDRTGVASALFLSALGVDRELIYHDYLLSAENIKSKYARTVKKNPEWAPMLTVKREYLEAAFDEIDSRYGGMENYLVNILNVDIETLRRIYLE